MTLDKENKTVSLQSVNAVLTLIVGLLCAYIISDLNSIKDRQYTQGLDIVRIDTNQKTVMDKMKTFEVNQEEIKKNQQGMISDINYLKAIHQK